MTLPRSLSENLTTLQDPEELDPLTSEVPRMNMFARNPTSDFHIYEVTYIQHRSFVLPFFHSVVLKTCF